MVNVEEIAFLRIRYKEPEADTSRLLEWVIGAAAIRKDIAEAGKGFRFTAAVAAFAQQLRGGIITAEFDYSDIARLAQQARGEDPSAYRGEFPNLVNLANSKKRNSILTSSSVNPYTFPHGKGL